MNRYLLSFLISSFIYIIIFASYFHTDTKKTKALEKTDTKISFKILQKQKVKKNIEKIIKKKHIIKKVRKEIKEPIPIKKVKQEKKTIYKKNYHKKVKQKPVIKNKVTQPTNEKMLSIKKNIQTKKEKEIVNNSINITLQNKFLNNLKLRIDSNKYYPSIAKKRTISGYVDVSFALLKNGDITNIVLTSTKSYFKKSVQEALKKSFPVNTDTSGFSFPLTVKFQITFKLL